MTEKRERTQKGLPIVSKETVDTVFRSDAGGSEKWGEKLERTKKRLAQEQPHLVKFIESQVGKYPEDLHNAMFEIAVGTYAVLEQQAGADQLSSTFGVSSEEKG